MAHYTAHLWLLIGTFVLGLGAPFAAVLILDGVVALIRRLGVRPLVQAVILTVITVGIGYGLWLFGVQQSTLAASTRGDLPDGYIAEMLALMQTMLLFTVPIALGAFVIRTIWTISRARRRELVRY